jgi:hypothetical protein
MALSDPRIMFELADDFVRWIEKAADHGVFWVS